MPISLFSHNAKAYEAAAQMLQEVGRAAVIHPTGTGKSFIAFQLAADNPDQRILWLSPSEYIFKTQLESLHRQAPEVGGNITFCTYARLLQRRDSGELQADYIVLDEFHRCGAEKWGEGVQALLRAQPQAKVLGLSATHVRYLDNQRNMAEELFDGHVASEMTLGEAIVRGILPAPKYVTTVYRYSEEIQRLQRKVETLRHHRDQAEAYLEALRRALEQSEGLPEIFEKHIPDRCGKYLVFCADYQHLLEMRSRVGEWFSAVDSAPHIYTAYSNDPETSRAFHDFKADNSRHLKLLFCIDMLNEGIHVADVDGVVLFRPTVSPIIYKQQIGRALSAGAQGQPVIFDIVNNFDHIDSISSVEKELFEAACRFYGNDRAEQVVTERFQLYDEVRSCREIFGALQNCIEAGWDSYYDAARIFREENGHLEIPRRYKTEEGLALGDWLYTQRKIRCGKVAGHLTAEQIARLDAIGMEWGSVRELAWARAYEAAQTYYETYGNLLVPSQYETEGGVRLGEWIIRQRQQYAAEGVSKQMTPERIEKLNEIGMVWSAISYQWEMNYAQAAKFYAENGHLDVPVDYETQDGFRLGLWLHQLRMCRAGKTKSRPLTEEQIRRLDEIGMQWVKRYEAQWQRQYENARRYYEGNGHLQIPVSYTAPDGSALGKWIARQRTGRKDLSAERIELLNEIGMVWGNDPWQHRYELASSYKDTYGTVQIPAKYRTEDGIWLGKWVYQQKKALQETDTLTGEQREKLQRLFG